MNTFLLRWDHSAWAGWILQSAAVGLALSLAGLAAAALTRRWHPSLRCLILTVFVAAPGIVLTAGFPFPAIGQAVNASGGQAAGPTGDPGRDAATHGEPGMGISVFQRHPAGDPGTGADPWRLPEAARAGIHAAGLVWLVGWAPALLSHGSLTIPGRTRRGVCLLGALAAALSVHILMPSPVFAEETPAAADSNKPLSAPDAATTTESQPNEMAPPQLADPVPIGKPLASSMNEAVAKLIQLMDAYVKSVDDSAKPGSSPPLTFTADRVTTGPANTTNTVILQGHVRIALSNAVLEAEHVVIESSRKEMAGAVITAVGKYTMTTATMVIEGGQEDSKLEIPEHGTPSVTNSSVRARPTSP